MWGRLEKNSKIIQGPTNVDSVWISLIVSDRIDLPCSWLYALSLSEKRTWKDVDLNNFHEVISVEELQERCIECLAWMQIECQLAPHLLWRRLETIIAIFVGWEGCPRLLVYS
jgi:hypothetical protein